jgi:thiamine biosynthesis lipoprotein
LFLVVGVLFFTTSCPSILGNGNPKPRQAENYVYFDTVSQVITYAGDSSEVFEKNYDEVFEILSKYHKLFDIYNEYSGVTNLSTLNKNAGGEAMKVEPELVDFLLYAKELYTITDGEMNIMLGSVLRLWHDARTTAIGNPSKAYIPSAEALAEANLHTDISLLEIDIENSTVRITDPEASIDVGALGKGYATELAAKHLEAKGVTSYVLNIGGNIRILGHKPDGTVWKTGVTNPRGDGYVKYINIANISCVTSGDYERYYTVDGVRYHHIIDKDTLMPSDYFSSITVLTADSGLADALSTALFSMSLDDGKAFLSGLDIEVEVLWIDKEGNQYTTEGFERYAMDH